ncbi:MAG: transporter substrate-binding domain-containing protein, partial [Oscillospiraceae bacterium]
MKPKLKKLFAVIVAMVIFVSPCSVISFASEEQQVVRVVFPIQTGLTEIDKNGNYTGYSYDYLKKVAQFTGWQYEIITFPDMETNEAILKSMEMIKNGEADLIGGMLKNDELLKDYDYPENNYGVVYNVLSASENNNIISESNYMLKGKLKIAVLERAKRKKAELADFLNDAKV